MGMERRSDRRSGAGRVGQVHRDWLSTTQPLHVTHEGIGQVMPQAPHIALGGTPHPEAGCVVQFSVVVAWVGDKAEASIGITDKQGGRLQRDELQGGGWVHSSVLGYVMWLVHVP
jgi:hypothetical protein